MEIHSNRNAWQEGEHCIVAAYTEEDDYWKLRIDAYVRFMSGRKKRGDTILVADDHLDPKLFNNIFFILSVLWFTREIGGDMCVVAGPMICTDNEYASLEVMGDESYIELAQEWLSPAFENKVLLYRREGSKLIIEGQEMTISSIRRNLEGREIYSGCGGIDHQKVLEKVGHERVNYWMNQIYSGPNVTLYRVLEGVHRQIFTTDEWFLGVWPLFAGYSGSMERSLAYVLLSNNGSREYYDKLNERNIVEAEALRIWDLENNFFSLPCTFEDLIKSCEVLIKFFDETRANEPQWVGKNWKIGPLFFWDEVVYQKQQIALKSVREKLIKLEVS